MENYYSLYDQPAAWPSGGSPLFGASTFRTPPVPGADSKAEGWSLVGRTSHLQSTFPQSVYDYAASTPHSPVQIPQQTLSLQQEQSPKLHTHEAENGQLAPRKVPKRVSCMECHKRRTKCDRARPMCSTCSKRGFQCQYYISPTKQDELIVLMYNPPAVQTAQQTFSSQQRQSPKLNAHGAEETSYVNTKQIHRILKRRKTRQEQGIVFDTRKPYVHESRHEHAVLRPRGPGGRFLCAEETLKRNAAGGPNRPREETEGPDNKEA